MGTENLREKINMLTNMIQAEDLQRFQAQAQVDVASESTGDAQVDQALAGQATNAKAQVLACARRIVSFREKLDALNAELNGK